MTGEDRLRMLLLSPSSIAGGAEEILFRLVRRLPAHGADPHVVLLQEGPLADRLRDAGAAPTIVPSGRLRDPLDVARVGRRLAGVLGEVDPHVCVSSLPKGHLYLAVPARRRRIPALFVQMNIPRDPPFWLDRVAARLPVAGVVALSEQAAAAQRRLARTPVTVVHPGTDPSTFTPDVPPTPRHELGMTDDELLIGIVGRLERWKGQDVFLRAAALALPRLPPTRFAVVGGALLGIEGDYPDELRRLAEQLGIAHRVVFTGHRGDVPSWMTALDVAVNASASEPFGMVVIEAMAAGTPVVAVDAGGPRDIVEQGVHGLLVSRSDPSEIAEALVRLGTNAARRRRLGAAGRRRVLERFTEDRMTADFVAVCREASTR